MDAKTLLVAAPFLRRLYRKLPPPLRWVAITLAVLVVVAKFRRRGEESAEEAEQAGA